MYIVLHVWSEGELWKIGKVCAGLVLLLCYLFGWYDLDWLETCTNQEPNQSVFP